MNFRCARVAHHANDLAAGGAANDGVIDQYNALALQQMLNRIQLKADAEVANALLGLNECASYVVIANESKAERDAAFIGVADGRGNSRIGNWNHEVCNYRSLPGKFASERLAALLHRTAKDYAIRTREVDMLEDTARLFSWRGKDARVHAFTADNHQLSGSNIALIVRADQIEGAGLRSKDNRWPP